MKPKREKVEMVDGRVYFSDDNWQTVWLSRGYRNGRSHRKVKREEANFVRFLAVSQRSWEGDRI